MTQHLTLEDDGLVGEFSAGNPFAPAILVLSGSGGGHPGARYLSVLNGAGFNVLALSYFGAPGLPQELHEIPLEYFDRALDWLRAHPGVDGYNVFVLARSRGTEAAQLLALRRPEEVTGLLLGSPTYVVVKAWPGEGAAWTRGGEPVPFHPEGWPTGPFPLDAPARIPLEEYPGPVLLVSGGADEVWPSRDFAEAIVATRQPPRVTEHLTYPHAGHGAGTLLTLDPETALLHDAVAHGDAWPRALAFLNRHRR
ncbi:Dienelactone hydrolase [Kytococcus aerolatus]|uniref:Dienelactone hydrolase n=1 Tax=Kytococcus aerolatus TaxID=592308 RepID=A0A212TF84_9MICO|nr:acyl-CoA thioester hydrolase/BAAT C-terminal domain-containing protein [Kytococcus aerolatus]SNC64707.1 Dienelactone hydrolase [Kytococcus aerolatus]